MPASQIDLKFADGEYTFRLPIEQISELQRKCGIGIGGLHARVMKGFVVNPASQSVNLVPSLAEFYALDVIETIRHGLIGGGRGVVNGEEVKVTPLLANKLVEAYVLGQPLIDAWNVAGTILATTIIGFEPPKKASPAKARARPRKTKTDA